MKKIITCILIKALQIFLPFFLIVLAVALAVAPIFIAFSDNSYGFNRSGWWFLGLVISIPLGITIVTMVNNFTEWDNIFTAHDIKNAISEYKIRRSDDK